MLKLAVSEELKKLTTHVPSINYNETIEMLDAKGVNYLEPKAVNSFINTGVESKGLIRKDSNTFLKRILKFILLVNLILPYTFWKFLIEPRIKEIEFKSTFRFAVSITLVPLWLVVLIVIIILAKGVYVSIYYIIFIIPLFMITAKL